MTEPKTFLTIIRERRAQASRNVTMYREQLERAELEQQTWTAAENLELGRHAKAVGRNERLMVAEEPVPPPVAPEPATPLSNIDRVRALLREYGEPITIKDLTALATDIPAGTVSSSVYVLTQRGEARVADTTPVDGSVIPGRVARRYQYANGASHE